MWYVKTTADSVIGGSYVYVQKRIYKQLNKIPNSLNLYYKRKFALYGKIVSREEYHKCYWIKKHSKI